MSAASELSHAGRIARTHDPDRFLVALFAPAARREALFLLIAFNHELVKALEMARGRTEAGPIGALIRLQWWREIVEGATRRHELAEPLGATLAAGVLEPGPLLGIIEAREAEAEGLACPQEWRAAQLGGAGGMQVAMAHALGVRDDGLLTRLRAAGAAYAAGAMIRYEPAIAASGRIAVPDAVLGDAAGHARGFLEQSGRQWLDQCGRPRLGRHQIAAALPIVLARRDLRRPPRSQPRGLGDRLALISAWLRGSP